MRNFPVFIFETEKKMFNIKFHLGELLLDWFLMHFEDHYDNLSLIRQIIFYCCSCLMALGVLHIENDTNSNDLFQV